MQITVLGAGAGGLTTAADLTLSGHTVMLFELPRFEQNLENIRRNHGIELLGAANEGKAMPDTLTTDPAVALEDPDVVLQVVPNFGYRSFAEAIAAHLAPDTPLVLTSANTLGALQYRRFLEDADAPDVKLGETPSLPYNARKTGPATVSVIGTKRRLGVAGLDTDHTAELVDLLNEAFPFTVYPAANVLETSLMNGNPIIHPVGSLLNVAAIEGSDDEYFLYQNVTKSVGTIMTGVDDERVAIGDALDLDVKTLGEYFHEWYDHGRDEHYATTANAIRTSPLHNPAAGPDGMTHRYIEEDVPYGLVPLSSLGDAVGVDTPVIDALIALASAINGVDYSETGRTLDACGLEHGRDSLEELLGTGAIPARSD